MRSRWFALGALACVGAYSVGLTLAQHLFDRSVIYPH